MTRAYLGLGGNLGDVAAAFAQALDRLDAHPRIAVGKVSSLYRTPPWGPVAQPPFLNMVAAVETQHDPHGLLDACLAVERELGRVRDVRYGPRTIDIDLLLFGETAIRDADLAIPHPRILERAFVLVPLAEIAADLDVGGTTVREALGALDPKDVAGIEKVARPLR